MITTPQPLLAQPQLDPPIAPVIKALRQLRQDALDLEAEFAAELQRVSPRHRPSAQNLIHYLALRRHDLRDLQRELRTLGVASLGQIEAHVMASLLAVLKALYRMEKRDRPADIKQAMAMTYDAGTAILEQQAIAALGPAPADRAARIMVTMPSAAAEDPAIIRNLLAQGMDIMRINCAHDGPEAWGRMIQHLRQAERDLGQACRISFDLAGPKLRTGTIAPGPEVVKWHPHRNGLGQVRVPAIVYLSPSLWEPADNAVVLPVSAALLAQAQVGDVVRLTDTRRRVRHLRVMAVDERGCRCHCDRTGYVMSGLPFQLCRDETPIYEGAIGRLPPTTQAIPLAPGDPLVVRLGTEPGRAAIVDPSGAIVTPATISCELPEVFRDVKPGDRIFFDDGKIAGVIQTCQPDHFTVAITSAVGGSAKLKGEKGINLPDTELNLPPLTEKDRADLPFVVAHGDLVALSFVQYPNDMGELIRELANLGGDRLGIILKIETQTAFNQLPRLLLAALQRPPVAVMVARGDLGVEVGFERLSEVQEEILWLCEAAHVPVIWATQVLESLAKGGMPSRAEVTDAAASSRAECVMLNKGPYIELAMQFLCDVLHRMQAHREKNAAMLRKLKVSELREV